MRKQFLILSVVFWSLAATATNYYVKATGGNDSSSGEKWSEAFASIEKALLTAGSSDVIYVAAGVYTGNYEMKEGVTVLGGYPADASDGTTDANRVYPGKAAVAQQTILRPITGRALTQAAVFTESTLWEGFVIEGTAIVIGSGGGAYLWENGILRNSIIQSCEATNYGGGIYAGKGSRIEGCLVTNNTAADGAGVYTSGGVVLNCTIIDNIATGVQKQLSSATAPAIGNFYYNDRTWSVTLDNSKSLIGVICYLSPFGDRGGLIMYNQGSTGTYDDSMNWASGMEISDFKDWRLPTITEWLWIQNGDPNWLANGNDYEPYYINLVNLALGAAGLTAITKTYDYWSKSEYRVESGGVETYTSAWVHNMYQYPQARNYKTALKTANKYRALVHPFYY